MWFFMYISYVLTLISFLLMLFTGIQGYFRFDISGIGHATWATLAIIVYLFTQTLVMFFFIGTGSSIKEYTQEHNLDLTFRKKVIEIKKVLFPSLMVSLGLFMTQYVLGAAVDTKHVPGWVHGVLFIIAMLHYAKLIVIEHGSFKKNTWIIL